MAPAASTAARAPTRARRTGGRHHAEFQSRAPTHPHSHAHATDGMYRNRSATWGARPGTRGLAGMSVRRNQAPRNDGIREARPPPARALRISTSTVSAATVGAPTAGSRSEEHTSELQSLRHLVCRLLLEKKKKKHDPCH